jgi:hypothetical protein
MSSYFREIQNNFRQYRTDPTKDLSDKKLQAFKERLKVIYNKLDKRLTKLRRREERNQMTKFIQTYMRAILTEPRNFSKRPTQTRERITNSPAPEKQSKGSGSSNQIQKRGDGRLTGVAGNSRVESCCRTARKREQRVSQQNNCRGSKGHAKRNAK